MNHSARIVISKIGEERFILGIKAELSRLDRLEDIVKELESLGQISEIKREKGIKEYGVIFQIMPSEIQKSLFSGVIKRAAELYPIKAEGENYSLKIDGSGAYRISFDIQRSQGLKDINSLLVEGIEILDNNKKKEAQYHPTDSLKTSGMNPLERFPDLTEIYEEINKKLKVTAGEIQSSTHSNNLRAARAVISRYLIERHNTPDETIAELLNKSKPTITKLSQKFSDMTLTPYLQNPRTYAKKALKSYNGPID